MRKNGKRIRSRWGPHADRERKTAFGQWLSEHRIAQGLRQSDLAAALKIHSGRVSELETGARRPDRELAGRLHAALGDVPPPPWPPD